MHFELGNKRRLWIKIFQILLKNRDQTSSVCLWDTIKSINSEDRSITKMYWNITKSEPDFWPQLIIYSRITVINKMVSQPEWWPSKISMCMSTNRMPNLFRHKHKQLSGNHIKLFYNEEANMYFIYLSCN